MSFKTMLLLAAAALPVLSGQPVPQTLKADIPFTFRVGDRVFEPGVYQVAASASPRAVIIKTESGKTLAFANANATYAKPQEAGSALLVFNRYGSSLFLSRVLPIGTVGAELMQSRSEKETVKQARAEGTTYVKLTPVK